MAGYKLTAAVLNRKKTAGKVADGLALAFRRNKDGTLSAIQRIKDTLGKESDITIATISGEISQERLQAIRNEAYALKLAAGKGGAPVKVMTFSDAWDSYRKQMVGAVNSKWSPATLKQLTARMLNHVAPTALWTMPVGDITAGDIRDALETVRREQPKLAPKVLQLVGQVLASVTSKAGLASNQARLLKSELKAIEKKVVFEKLPAITDLAGLGRLLAAIENSNLYLTTRVALLLQAYTAQRSGEVAGAKWSEFVFHPDGRATWTIPRERMKVSDREKKPFDQKLVIPPAAVALLKRLPTFGGEGYLFTPRHGDAGHITVEAFSQAFQRLGFRGVAVPHGWRSSLKTLAEEAADDDSRPLFASSWVEGVLDHSPQGIEKHYQRGKMEAGMSRVLAWWSDQLEKSKFTTSD